MATTTTTTEWGLLSQSEHCTCDVTQMTDGTTVTNTNITSYRFIKQKVWPVINQHINQHNLFKMSYNAPALPQAHPWAGNLRKVAVFGSTPDIYSAGCQRPSPTKDPSPLSPLVKAFTAGASTTMAGQRMPTPREKTSPDTDDAKQPIGTNWTNNKEAKSSAVDLPEYMTDIVRKCKLFPRIGNRSNFQEAEGKAALDRAVSPIPPPRVQDLGSRRSLSSHTSGHSSQQSAYQRHMMHGAQAWGRTSPAVSWTASSPNLLSEHSVDSTTLAGQRSYSSNFNMNDLHDRYRGDSAVDHDTCWDEQHTTPCLVSTQLDSKITQGVHPYLELSQEGCTLCSGRILQRHKNFSAVQEPVDLHKGDVMNSDQVNELGTVRSSKKKPSTSQQREYLADKVAQYAMNAHNNTSTNGNRTGDQAYTPFTELEFAPLESENEDNAMDDDEISPARYIPWCGKLNQVERQFLSAKNRKKSLFMGISPERFGTGTGQTTGNPAKTRTKFDRGLISQAHSESVFGIPDHELYDADHKRKPWRLKCRQRPQQEPEFKFGLPVGGSTPLLDYYPATKGEGQAKLAKQKTASPKKTHTDGGGSKPRKVVKKRVRADDSTSPEKLKRGKSNPENDLKLPTFEGNSKIAQPSGSSKDGASVSRTKRRVASPKKSKERESNTENKKTGVVPFEDRTRFASPIFHVESPTSKPTRKLHSRSHSMEDSEQRNRTVAQLYGGKNSGPPSFTPKDMCLSTKTHRKDLSCLRYSSAPTKLTPSQACARDLFREKEHGKHSGRAKHYVPSVSVRESSDLHQIVSNMRADDRHDNCSSVSDIYIVQVRRNGLDSSHRPNARSVSQSRIMYSANSRLKSGLSSGKGHKTVRGLTSHFIQTENSPALANVNENEKKTKGNRKLSSCGKTVFVRVKKMSKSKPVEDSEEVTGDSETITPCLKQTGQGPKSPVDTKRDISDSQDEKLETNSSAPIKHVNFDLQRYILGSNKKTTNHNSSNTGPKLKTGKPKGGPSAKSRSLKHGETCHEERIKKRKCNNICSLGVQTENSYLMLSQTKHTLSTVSTLAKTVDTGCQTASEETAKSSVGNGHLMIENVRARVDQQDGDHAGTQLSSSTQPVDLCNSANSEPDSVKPEPEAGRVSSTASDERISIDISTSLQLSEDKLSEDNTVRPGLSDVSMISFGSDFRGITATRLFAFV